MSNRVKNLDKITKEVSTTVLYCSTYSERSLILTCHYTMMLFSSC